MSAVKEKAEQIKTQGALERGEFNPTGKPKEIYQYWHKHTDKAPKTENFCHFWRVVAIWAPLMFLRNSISDLAEKSVTWYVVAGIVLATIISLSIFVSPVWLLALAFPWILANGVTLAVLFDDCDIKDTWDDDWIWKVFLVATFAGTGIYLILRGLYHGIEALPEPSPKVEKIGLIVGSTIVIGVAAALYIFSYVSFGLTVLWITLGALAIVAVLVGLIFLGGYVIDIVGEWLTAKREAAKAKRDAEEELKKKQFWAYLNGESEFNPYAIPERVPSKFDVWATAKFKALGDFFLLVWNIIRVNKWKICPIVKIED